MDSSPAHGTFIVPVKANYGSHSVYDAGVSFENIVYFHDHSFADRTLRIRITDRSGQLIPFTGGEIELILSVQSRDRKTAAPRDNVLFELGFFMSRLRRDRTFLLVPSGGPELKMPSDFKGLTPIAYTPLTGERGEVPGMVLTSTVYELEQRIKRLGCRLC